MVIEVKLEHIDKIYHNQQGDVHALHDICLEIKEKGITFIIGASGFRVIIVTVANSLGNIRVFELLPKLKTKKYGWCIA